LDGQHIKLSAFLNPVFNAGARTLLRKPMEILCMKIVLAYLLSRYKFEDALNHDGLATGKVHLNAFNENLFLHKCFIPVNAMTRELRMALSKHANHILLSSLLHNDARKYDESC